MESFNPLINTPASDLTDEELVEKQSKLLGVINFANSIGDIQLIEQAANMLNIYQAEQHRRFLEKSTDSSEDDFSDKIKISK